MYQREGGKGEEEREERERERKLAEYKTIITIGKMFGRFFCGCNREFNLPLNEMVLDNQSSLKLNKTKSNGNMIGSDEQTSG